MKIVCKIIGCSFKYNFTALPDKCICKRCKSKWKFNPGTLEWYSVHSFNDKLGTDEEMIKRWHPKII